MNLNRSCDNPNCDNCNREPNSIYQNTPVFNELSYDRDQNSYINPNSNDSDRIYDQQNNDFQQHEPYNDSSYPSKKYKQKYHQYRQPMNLPCDRPMDPYSDPQCDRPMGPPCDRPMCPPCDRPMGPPCDRPMGPPCDRPMGPPCDRPMGSPCDRPMGPPCDRPMGPHCDRPMGPPCDRPMGPPCDRPMGPPCNKPMGPPCDRPMGPPCDRAMGSETQYQTNGQPNNYVSNDELLHFLLKKYKIDKNNLISYILTTREKKFKITVIQNFYEDNGHLIHKPIHVQYKLFKQWNSGRIHISKEEFENFHDQFMKGSI